MKKIILFLLFLFLLFLFCFFKKDKGNGEKQPMMVGNTHILVEIADSASKRAQGLSGRENLLKKQGMLFVFDFPSKHTFWMKGMKFPLDFIWINNFKVVDLSKEVKVPEPESKLEIIKPKEEVDMVLEVNSGFIEENQIKIGDKLNLLK